MTSTTQTLFTTAWLPQKERLGGTDLLEYGFCPRFTYFERFLDIPEHQEKRYNVLKGREVHEEKQQLNRGYLRKNLGCIDRRIGVKLYGSGGLYVGELDEILFLDDGTAAPLDYKWSNWNNKIRRTYQLQLALYALLIEENFHIPVKQGFLVYVRSENHLVTYPVDTSSRLQLEAAIKEIFAIRNTGFFPQAAESTKQCLDCTYRNLCPRV